MLFDCLTDERQLRGREVLLQLALGYSSAIGCMSGCAHITLSGVMEYYRCSLCRCQLLAFYDLCVSVDILYVLPLVVCVVRSGYLLELLSVEGGILLLPAGVLDSCTLCVCFSGILVDLACAAPLIPCGAIRELYFMHRHSVTAVDPML